MPNHPVVNMDAIARSAIRENHSWIPAPRVDAVVEMILADYEMSENFSRSFKRVASLYSVAAALSIFSAFVPTAEIMRLHKEAQEGI